MKFKPSYLGGCPCGAPQVLEPTHKYRKRHENAKPILGPSCEKANACSNMRRRAVVVEDVELLTYAPSARMSFPRGIKSAIPLYTSYAHIPLQHSIPVSPPPVEPCIICTREDPEQVLVDGRCSDCRP